MVWNTFGPISESVLAVYCPEWTDSTLALLGNWGNIMYVLPIIPVMWYYQTEGLRPAVVMTGAIMTIGTIARCIPFKLHAFHYFNDPLTFTV